MSKYKGMSREEVRQHSTRRLDEMRAAGIKFVSVMGCNKPGEDCEACMAIKDQKIENEFATPLPLPDCDKKFCKCIYIAVQ